MLGKSEKTVDADHNFFFKGFYQGYLEHRDRSL